MVQMAFGDWSHTFHQQVTQHVFVILLWGILTSPPIWLQGRSYSHGLFPCLEITDEQSVFSSVKWVVDLIWYGEPRHMGRGEESELQGVVSTLD